MEFYHSAKGTTWKNHKYIAIKNGRYIYPNKRQGFSARKKTNQSTASNIPIRVFSDVNKINETVFNSPIDKYADSLKGALDDLKKYAEEASRTITNAALDKATKAGERAIKRILGTDFKLTGIIDMNGRGLRTDTKVKLGPIKYSR